MSADRDRDIKAYRLHDRAVALRPAPRERAWAAAGSAAAAILLDEDASAQGWQLLCPCDLAVRWNGGPGTGDLEVSVESADAAGFARSELGGGVLTFHPGYLWKTGGGRRLWVRGPVNLPKDGLEPLESIVDTSRFPCTIAVHWRFTRPNQVVRFAAGEPFGTVLLHPEECLETFAPELLGLEDALQACERELQQSSAAAAPQDVLRRLRGQDGTAGARGEPPMPPPRRLIPPPKPMPAAAAAALFKGTHPA
ncbi:MAG: hypothetical protein JOZ15_17305, partial [Acidobacteria bacterium]|nr:hypothetical protein [Acidobacteriota bacterium]